MIFTQKMVEGTSSRDCVHVSFDLQCGRNKHSIKFKFTIILIRRMHYVFVAGLIQPVYQKKIWLSTGRRNYLTRRRKIIKDKRRLKTHKKLAEVFHSLQETEADETSWERFTESA